MKRLLLVGISVLAAILVAAWLLLPSFLDVEKHRPAIERAIASATGRTVSLGALKLKLLPLPRLAAQGLEIGEDPEFGTEAFLEAQRVEIRVRLWPLLKRTISVVSLTIDRPHVRVVRDREGRWSVLSLATAGTRTPAGGSIPPAQTTTPTGGAPSSATAPGSGLSFSADKIRLSGGKLTVVDSAFVNGTARTAEVSDLDCTITDLSLTSPVTIDLAFDLEGVGRMRLEGRVGPFSGEGAGTFPLDVTFGLSGSKASLAGKLTGLHERPAIDVRVTAQKAALQEIAPLLRLVGPLLPAALAPKGEITLDATLRGPLDEPARVAIEGTATVADLELADGSLEKPITAIHGKLALLGDRAEITDFGAALGLSSVSGSCTLTRFERPVLDVRLVSPMLDVDELLSLLAASPAAGTQPVPEGSGAPPPPARASTAVPGAPTESVLPEVTLRGDLAVARAKAMNLKLSSAAGKLAMERGSAHLTGISVDLYAGRMMGELTARVAEPGPPFALSARLDRVDFGALSADLSKDLAGLLSGTLETTLEVRGRGLDTGALRQDLTGHGSLALRDGRLTSFGILKTISKALQAAGGRGIGENETPFRSLSATFKIANGRATTEDLTLESADITLKGRGSIGLDLSLDLDVEALLSPAVSTDMVAKTSNLKHLLGREGRIELGLTARGSLTAPSIGIDRDMIERAARSALEEKVREKGESLLRKLLDRKKKG